MLKIIKDIITDHYNYLLFKLILFLIRKSRLSETMDFLRCVESLIITKYSNKLEIALKNTKRRNK